MQTDSTYDPDRWAAFWLKIAGAAHLIGFLTPIFNLPEWLMGSGDHGDGRWQWSWSWLDSLSPWQQIRTFLPPVLGALCLHLSRPAIARHRRQWLLVGSGAIVVLWTMPGTAQPLPEGGG